MCNACGFLCCGWDTFSGCGCDGCPEPECWSDEEDFDDDDDYYPGDYEFAPRCSHRPVFRCVEVTP